MNTLDVESAQTKVFGESFHDSIGCEPIRSELFGLDRLEVHARELAAAVGPGRLATGRPLLQQVRRNRRILNQVHGEITDAYRRRQRLGGDAEWLLDNFHIVSDALREIESDLPAGYYRRLPKVAEGPFAGLPRVYLIAIELIAHSDSCLDESNIVHFANAFQAVAPLTIGELWAIPTMLRMGLVENLRRLAEQITQTRTARSDAAGWIERHSRPAEAARDASAAPLPHPPRDCSDPFLLHLWEHLRDHQSDRAAGVEWLDNILAARGQSTGDVLRREQQRLAVNQVSIGNCVTSLRLLSATDWTLFFEQTSRVEAILREDPAGVYGRQDFATRDRCRRVVEQLAWGSGRDETEVARLGVELAQKQRATSPENFVGYYLLGEGLGQIEHLLGYRLALGERLRRGILKHARGLYFGGIAVASGFIVIALVLLAAMGQPLTFAAGSGLALLALLPASELALGLMNRWATAVVPPRVLPKLDVQAGIPADCPTFVVIPGMLIGPRSARALLARLEVHYLSSHDDQLWFALLTDFADAASQHCPEDAAYLESAVVGVRELNRKYAAAAPPRFFLFHRERRWNPAEGCWMGWERKRGKLAEFNRLLQGDSHTSFTTVEGDRASLPRVRYVITLDADTQLPREAAPRLVATLAHPLNRARFDPAAGRVVAGYGVLQPRISLSLPDPRQSLFSRAYSHSAGLDPYTTAVSDVYQDLFQVGSFTGKGIYDLDAFEKATGETFPQNQILSHDLIEGNYARCGLATDIELLDGFPASYLAYARREHRWARGDWQILPWLLPRVPAAGGPRRKNPLPLVERWKIFDNLRRSLLAPMLVLLLLLGWTVLPGGAWLWTGFVLLVIGWPALTQLTGTPTPWPLKRKTLRARNALPTELGATIGQTFLSLAMLADRAWSMADAIARTLLRMLVTRRRLLEWETAAATERRLGNDAGSFWKQMWPAAIGAAAALVALQIWRPAALAAAGPILLAWIAAPAIAYWVSRPRQPREPALAPAELRYLRRLARQTWSFFETFVGPDDNWLPPDNFQEDPRGELAHRTSPTNIGLYLLANLTANDFGYLTFPDLIDRLERTFATLDRLERSHGHFLNWYDTQSLKPLLPAYLSTVDSGNLLASFITLAQGLKEKANQPDAPLAVVLQGVRDTLGLAEEAFRTLELPGGDTATEVIQEIESLFERLGEALENPPADAAVCGDHLRRIEEDGNRLMAAVQRLATAVAEDPKDLNRWTKDLVAQIDRSCAGTNANRDDLLRRCHSLIERATAFGRAMDFGVLYNHQRNLFSVGYNLTQGRPDGAHYDLLASEACLTSFLAIARCDAPRKHWFQLGRPLTDVAGSLALVSWGGTMFEYLMPRLFFRPIAATLLTESQRGAVSRQIEYGRQRNVPWGISESAFNALDSSLNYQYQAFGVPGLGLKWGLANDLVVAPYAAALAVSIAPKRVVRNFEHLTKEGGLGAYGFYESLDYSRDRLPPKVRRAVVKCFMAHHQGMVLLALGNYLLDDPIPRRFHAEPMVQATELLLQERVPQAVPLLELHDDEISLPQPESSEEHLLSRRLTTPHTSHPRTHLLGNSSYRVMVTNVGSGQSSQGDLAISRWREDVTRDDWGQFLYLRDLASDEVWSAGYQPVRREADEYEVIYSADKAEIRRVDGDVETHLEITVSPESPAEIRRVKLTNHGSAPRSIELTSYLELALAPQAADLAHPAFSKLFLETEYIEAENALLCRRRPRSADQKPIWAVHVLGLEAPASRPVEFETDRGRFLGRGRTPADPAAMAAGARLSGTVGPVLDPIFSLRCRIELAPESSAEVAFTTAVADSREEALALAGRYHYFHAVQRAFELAWAHGQLELRHLHLSPEDIHVFQRLAAHIFYANPAMRADAAVLKANQQGQPGLWRYGISGDNPIVVVWVDRVEEIPLVRQLLAAHAYWRSKGLRVDLVVLNEHETVYFEELQKELQALMRASEDRDMLDKSGGVYLRKAAQILREDQNLLQAAARCVLLGRRGTLARQIERMERAASRPMAPAHPAPRANRASPPIERRSGSDAAGLPELQFANGSGGFADEGREYIVSIPAGGNRRLPPAPWINVVANSAFGFLVSESGAGYTWATNSQTNRLTPWNNDPVADAPGEVVYLRDRATGAVWTPTPLPLGDSMAHQVRHGQGYTIFSSAISELEQELLLFVPPDEAIKIIRLTVRNRGRRPRQLSATFYAEWVLGTVRDKACLNVITELDAASGALLARNPFNADFPERTAYADVDIRPRSFTADRTEFLGRNGSLAAPAALGPNGLSGTVGPGIDPCAALQVEFDLPPGGERTITFFLGQTGDEDEIQWLLRRYREPAQVTASLEAARRRWDELLTAVQVKTPNPALDLLLNRWLLYQVTSCRLWARSALYQSGGAYGFRDQLQDSMALVHAAPEMTRAQILRAASRQFQEGDVQHWWHPTTGAGVRTRFSDDFLWLPYVVCQYLCATNDQSLLKEPVSYLSAPILRPEQEEDYRVPDVAPEKGTLYEHCIRAVEHGCRFGAHGLPLMGTGDWNDGMNRVGSGGRGESVWTGWFLLVILRQMAEVAQQQKEPERADKYHALAEKVRAALEEHAWDGKWYRRAYFDDGTPLGSAENPECRIDSLPQSWAAISGAADRERTGQALESVKQFLVRPADGLVLLFTPPFDKSNLEPGYIKGYVPGIRENGGQYTHAAIWVALAATKLGNGAWAEELLNLLNPIHHSASPELVDRYRVEPYVLAADVGGEPPHVGRGGWTWYTGSAAWYYRVALESLLGFRRLGNWLEVNPCCPSNWPHFEITYRHKTATYQIRVDNPRGSEHGVRAVELDGQPINDGRVPLVDDGQIHHIRIEMV